MQNTDYTEYLSMSPDELMKLQKSRGWVLSSVGSLVYKILRLLNHIPQSYHGFEYFEIGIGRGWGLELGWFFICSKDEKDSTKAHEVGHLIQNAAVGGWTMMMYCIGSALRFWYRRIFGITRPHYDAWWFEGQATELGTKYVSDRRGLGEQ